MESVDDARGCGVCPLVGVGRALHQRPHRVRARPLAAPRHPRLHPRLSGAVGRRVVGVGCGLRILGSDLFCFLDLIDYAFKSVGEKLPS